MKVVLGMSFLSFSNVDIKFTELGKLIWRSYTTAKVLFTTNWVKFIDKKEFAKAALNENFEIFIIHILALETIMIHLFRAAQNLFCSGTRFLL